MTQHRLVLAVVVTCALCAPLSSSAELAVSFESEAVRISGVTPGVGVAVLNVSRYPRPFAEAVMPRAAIFRDEDGDGEVEISPPDGVAWKSIWAVVDGFSGEFVVATPEDYPARGVVFDASQDIRPGPGGLLTRVVAHRQDLHLMLVRPRVSAWHAIVSDGGATDDDGENDGRVRIDVTAARNLLGGDERPGRIRPGDVLVAIDPRYMVFFAVGLAQ